MADYWNEVGGDAPAPPPPSAGRARRWPLVVVALLVVAALAVWFGRAGSSEQVLHVGSQRGGTKALMIASGVLDGAPYRVEWSEFAAAQNLLEAIGAGAVDVGMTGDAPFQFAFQSGSPIQAVSAQAAQPRPTDELAILVPKTSAIRNVAGLRGKRIATTRGSVGHYLILRALDAAGMTPADVRIVFLTPGDTKAAFDSGSIDAWSTWSPYTGAALAEGARNIADGNAYLTGYAFDVANTGSATAKQAVLTDYLRRETKALAWGKAHPQELAKVLAEATGLPPAIALFHVTHLSMIRVPIDAALKTEERDVVARFRKAGALAGSRALDGAYRPLDEGATHGS